MGTLETTRLELDSRRREVSGLKTKIDTQRGKLERTKSRGEAALDKTTKYTQHKETKLDAATAAYEALEAEIYDELSVLIKDSLQVKEYIKAVSSAEVMRCIHIQPIYFTFTTVH